MEVKLDLKTRIVKCASELFFKMGLRRVTMDDVAGECGVSKKTIYQHFKDKDTVVLEVTKTFLEREETALQQISDKAKDPIEEFVLISQWFRTMLDNIDPSLLFDMKKYHPRSWKFFLQHKEHCILCSMKDNLEKGKELGLYRQDINVDILSRFRVESTEMSFNNEVFPSNLYRIRDLQLQLFDHFVYGIVTEQGKIIFDSYKSSLSTTSL